MAAHPHGHLGVRNRAAGDIEDRHAGQVAHRFKLILYQQDIIPAIIVAIYLITIYVLARRPRPGK